MYFCNMISKNLLKYIRSLELKKYRKQEGCFVAEGPKVVGDLMKVMSPIRLVAMEEWYHQTGTVPRDIDVVVTDDELRKVSFLQHPQQVMGVFPIPGRETVDSKELLNGILINEELILALDGVQDPGNLGTIIRIADWFGIRTLVCSTDTADVYNPKVVQATMGSIARVKVIYTDLPAFLKQLPSGIPVYGTFLDGHDIYQQTLTCNGVIVMGNEGKGISQEVNTLVNHRLLIPHYPADRPTADSLNVAIATAITCAEFRRVMK